ncbi:MAG: protein kinase, partial [Acidobacteriota bacterium]
MLESTGARIGSFEILAPLGEGGMGAVFRARDPKLGRQVAIKILQHDLITSREHLRRFAREARAASALNHPNIVTIFEIDEYEGEPFIAMELVDGDRLRDLLVGGALATQKLLDIATQIADGLAAAHDRGIVHRDLKPENVMVNREGLVKILDFGLAHILREGGSNEPTDEMSGTDITSGQLLGTAAYMSPEQASGAPVDFRSDHFSFGSTLYELATGRRAFRRQSTMATLSAITNEMPEPIRQINRAMPAQLCKIVERCLAKNPRDRYSSTHDLAQALRTLRERHHGTVPITERFELPERLRARAWVAGAFLVVAGAIATTVALSRGGSPAPARAVGTLPQHVYLAVLPFNDANVQAEAQLFSRGLADAVSARLSRFSGLQVMPPSSSVRLLAEKADARRIAQELGATLLLRANVDTTGEKLRVRYSLFDPLRGVDVATGTLNGSTKNFWDTQDDVSEAIARDLHLSGRARPVAVGLESATDQESFVHALGYLQRYENEQSVDAAIQSLRDLMATSPDSAMVVATLGRAYLAKYSLTHERQWADRAITVCDRARTLDPDSTDVLMTLGDIARVTGRYDQAIGYYKRALALQPDSPEVALKLGNAYQAGGNFVEAEGAFRRGIELRPTWWSGYNELGFLNLTRNHYGDAESQFQTVIKLNPDSPWGYSNSGAVYLRQ